MGYNYMIPILITYSLLTIPIAFPMLDSVCISGSKPFTSIYNESRLSVMFDLIVDTLGESGFAYASRGSSLNESEPAFGMALCRADVSTNDCHGCVQNAANKLIRDSCPIAREAIIWQDFCSIKYSDVDFFGKIDTKHSSCLTNDSTLIPVNSTVAVEKLLIQLSQTAITSPKFFASGSTSVLDAENIYGMVQCTKDLSTDDCKTCLDGAITDLRNCSRNFQKSARFFYASCNVRCDI